MNDTLILDGDLIIDVNIDGEPDSVISVGHETIVRPITITENGHYEPEAGVDGFSSVDVDVPAPTYDTETWIFTMDDDSTVTKVVILDD